MATEHEVGSKSIMDRRPQVLHVLLTSAAAIPDLPPDLPCERLVILANVQKTTNPEYHAALLLILTRPFPNRVSGKADHYPHVS